MNERIKSLLVECGAELVKGTHNGQTGTAVNLPVGQMFDFEKFAELIVQECMEQVWYTREDGINGNVSEVIKERMKQHFGVEE
jgi:hypothetical protein